MKTLHYYVGLAALCFATFSNAQPSTDAPAAVVSEKVPLPKGPILKPLPAAAQWAVIYAAPKLPSASVAPSASPAAKIRTVIITKTGTTQREVETDSAGQTWLRWKIDGHEISYTPEGQYAVADPGPRPDFPDFAWISAQNYVSTAKIGTQDCYIFQDTITRPDSLMPIKATAAVDIATQLPVYLILNATPRTYKFSAAPAPLVVPPEVASIIATRPRLAETAQTTPLP